MTPHLRIARPVRDLAKATYLYCRGLDLRILGRFEDHAGFDGVMLGAAGGSYHLEFTRHRAHTVAPTPTLEDLLVLYLPATNDWHVACARMPAAGFRQVVPFNPYWERRGQTYEDCDGYRVVLQNAEWTPG
jgi:catechol 2,3-dioxygenase-like lactoylglutathione lyase family enzyme